MGSCSRVDVFFWVKTTHGGFSHVTFTVNYALTRWHYEHIAKIHLVFFTPPPPCTVEASTRQKKEWDRFHKAGVNVTREDKRVPPLMLGWPDLTDMGSVSQYLYVYLKKAFELITIYIFNFYANMQHGRFHPACHTHLYLVDSLI